MVEVAGFEPQPAACKAAALPKLSYTPEEIHPVTGSGAAQSLRPISTLEA